MLSFSNVLIDVLAIKNVITQSKATALRDYLSMVPSPRRSTIRRRMRESLST
ncbi:hypothetical protein [Vulcanisaeta distributa]|uniref:hypothetical protein n=1 Tax=Vulcanisaeta distributa TaxID=164451 RepID=UPI000A94147A|nr:hypothetical protein [Vulcanisaeta distributa]